MTFRILAFAALLLSALGCAGGAAGAEVCPQKKFPANAKVRSDELDDLYGKLAPADKPHRFAVLSPSADPEARRVAVGAENAAKRYGVTLEPVPPGDALATAPDAVLFVPGIEGARPPLDQARARGVPTIAVGSRVDGARLSVAADEALFGAMAAEYLHELFPLGASVGQISGPAAAPEAAARAAGFATEIPHYQGLTYAGSFAADGTKEKARQATVAAMAAHPDIKGLYAGNDDMAIGAVEALKSLKLFEVVVIGAGGSTAGREALARRAIKGTVARFPEREGSLAVEAGLRLLACQQVPPWIVSPQVTLTPKSLEDVPPITQ